ncbi:glycerol-3-phosphate acyltransferase [Fusibacter tunisiensis]|uniref:Acyl-phosphate glycerol 3-phosphate acyltransferase n=1 Tax=Fusibacter tunisiensis TaxID=1008308 RepID=A0ABS2MP77_9FIRM|nr:glycerol-3-phosphate acyltransferase [Fusibacter tunisiensis]MBM7561210.1 acyl-phosphate glycerol 3-phosphate acyltransferase [Fusibacter tunisiensis]
MENVFWAIGIGYLIGSIQPAFILGKLFRKVDIRTLGHGNSGASNATQSLGIKFGVAVALIDILKGVLSIVLTKIAEKSPASKPPCSRSESAGGG